MIIDALDEDRTDRFTRRHLYKDQSTVMVMPILGDTIPARVHDALMSMQRLPNQQFCPLLMGNLEVSAAYDQALRMVLTHPQFAGWKWMLTCEQDNLPPVDGFTQLVTYASEHDYDVLGGLYWIKGIDGVPQIWGDRADAENYRPQPPDLNGEVVDCWGTGMGFTLFRLDLFRDMPPPWFYTPPEDGMWTQDLRFFNRIHAHRDNVKVGVHCGVRVGHLDLTSGDCW
jgi:hypothetical protein